MGQDPESHHDRVRHVRRHRASWGCTGPASVNAERSQHNNDSSRAAAMLTLATPVVRRSSLGHDGHRRTIMVAGSDRMPSAPWAVEHVFIAVAVFAMGLLLGLDPLVRRAFGAHRLDECNAGWSTASGSACWSRRR